MNTRSKLSILTPDEAIQFRPNVVLCNEAKDRKKDAQERFFSALMDIVTLYPGEQLLMIRRRQAMSFGTPVIQPHLYLGLISNQEGIARSTSDGVLFPTSRYVDSSKSLHPIARSEGNIPESAFGMNAIWLFFLKLCDDQHALDIFVGNEEVNGWFAHPRRSGTFPYLHQDLSKALVSSSQPNTHPAIQFAHA